MPCLQRKSAHQTQMHPLKMKILPELFIVLFCFSSMSLCMPPFWQVNQLKVHEDVLKRGERDVSNSSESGPGPCSDDEDSPCHVGEPQMIGTSTEYPKPHIVSLEVETSITARFVSTTVVTVMKNRAPVSQDSNFRFRLTEDAFISDFFMVVEGETYQAEVQEKQVAQKAYNEARQRGQTAGQIKQSENDFTKFETNVNLSPKTTATFHLTFQELLRRKNGVFQHKINLFPNEIVQHLRAEVYINEPQGISFANITWEQDEALTTDFLYDALNVEYKSDERVHAQFNPSEVDQEGLSETGLKGDLVITYDVVHDSGAGHIEVVNGYFVHHISPVGIPVTRKDVVFVIDVSGSMHGSKLSQTKLAMSTIIDEIRDFDRFNIISFSHTKRLWKENLVEASGQNKEEAKTFVDDLIADGGTDIHQGVVDAVRQLQEQLDDTSLREAFPMIVLLTDGKPTSGLMDTNEIVKRASDAIQGEIALFSLAFGQDADYDLLEKLSGNNNGLARRIYHDSNPSLQLEGFYKEVANPLLFNVQVNYDETAVEMYSLTDTNFICYFEGQELVIAGKLKEDFTGNEISAVVSGNSFDVNVEWGLTKEITTEGGSNDNSFLKEHVIDDFAERLWAYVTIKDLLLKSSVTTDQNEKTLLSGIALSLSLKYKFVTPLTSLIVIKPENDQNDYDVLTEEERYSQFDYDDDSVSMGHGLAAHYGSQHYSFFFQHQPVAAMLLSPPVSDSMSYSYFFSRYAFLRNPSHSGRVQATTQVSADPRTSPLSGRVQATTQADPRTPPLSGRVQATTQADPRTKPPSGRLQATTQVSADPRTPPSGGLVQASTRADPRTPPPSGRVQATTQVSADPRTPPPSGRVQATTQADPRTPLLSGRVQATTQADPRTPPLSGRVQATTQADPRTPPLSGRVQATTQADPRTPPLSGRVQATTQADPRTPPLSGRVQATTQVSADPRIKPPSGRLQATTQGSVDPRTPPPSGRVQATTQVSADPRTPPPSGRVQATTQADPRTPLPTGRVQATTQADPRTPPPSGRVQATTQVDGDPHFRISLPEQNASLCFSVHGRDRMVVNLISDPIREMTFNAQFKSFNDVSNAESVEIKSYFTTVGIALGTNHLLVTPEEITFKDMNIDWTTFVRLTFHGYSIQVSPQLKLVAIRSTEGITVNIRRHQDERTWMPNKDDHLGIYVEDSSGFTGFVDGLLGQFYRNESFVHASDGDDTENDDKTATLELADKTIPLVWRPQQGKDCWHVRNKNATLSDPSNFEMSSLFQTFESK